MFEKLILNNIIDDTYYFDNFCKLCEFYKTFYKDLYDITIDLNNLKYRSFFKRYYGQNTIKEEEK